MEKYYPSIAIEKPTYDYSLRSTIGREPNAKKDYLSLQINAVQSSHYNYINTIENRLQNTSVEVRPGYSFSERHHIGFHVGLAVTYDRMKYSRHADFSFQGFGVVGEGSVMVTMPWNLQLEQRYNYVYKPENKLLNTAFNQLLWDRAAVDEPL